jgi:subtilisin family serine protease
MTPAAHRPATLSQRPRSGWLAALVLLALLTVPQALPSEAVSPARPGAVGAAFADDAVLLGLTSTTPASAARGIAARAGAVAARALGAGAHLLRVRPGRVEPTIAALRGQPGVRYAEPDYLVATDAVPNDPSFGLQWGLRNTGQTVNGVRGTSGADVRAAAAWNVTTGSRSVVVAQVDTGVDYNHPDLKGNVWTNPGGIGGCPAGTHGYNVLTASCNPMDTFGHGTHVAGIMGAVGNNASGVAGVNWTTTILPVKFANRTGSGTTSNLLTAIDWVLTAKAAGVQVRVLNDSLTNPGDAYSQALADQIARLGDNGILFVTAAGNTKQDNDVTARYPCNYGAANEICVAATDQKDRRAGFSNWGDQTVDLAAPGKNIYSTLPKSGYGYMSGTSMAAPMVSGAAALLLSRDANLSTDQLKAGILAGVDPLPSLSGLVRTGGRLNLCRALPGCTT